MAKFTSPIPLNMEYQGHTFRGPAGTEFRIPDSLRAAFDAEFGTRVAPSWTVNDEIANGGGSAAAHPDLAAHISLGLLSADTVAAHVAEGDPHVQYALDADLANHEDDGHVHDHDGDYEPPHSHPYAATVHTHAYSSATGIPSTFTPASHSHVDGDLPAGLARDSEVTTAVADHAATPHGGSLPAGLIVMWGGAVSAIPAGWLLCDGSNGTPDLRSRFIKGAAAGSDPGATGGSATHTHAGHSDHAALTHSGTAVADHAAHTHAYTQVVNHVHNQTRLPTATGGVTGFTVDTSMSGTPATSGVDTGNPTGGVASGTTANPSATLTHGVTQPSQHAAQSHSAHDTPNSEPAFYALAFIQKS